MTRWLATLCARNALICAVVLHALSVGATEDALAAVEDPLKAVEAAIAAQFSVDETSTKDLATALASADSASYLLFDVREPAEFERSHVRDARHLAPDTKPDVFEKGLGDKVKGKHLIFYCSVGYRSSVMADRVRDSAMKSGAVSVANLRGGLFRWYNEGRVVHDATDTTDAIHPYDRVWGAFVNERPGAQMMTAIPDGVGRTAVDSSEK